MPNFAGRKTLTDFRPDPENSEHFGFWECFRPGGWSTDFQRFSESCRDFRAREFGAPRFLVPRISEKRFLRLYRISRRLTFSQRRAIGWRRARCFESCELGPRFPGARGPLGQSRGCRGPRAVARDCLGNRSWAFMVEARAYAPGVRETIRWRILPGAGAFQRLPSVFSTVISARFGAPGAARGRRRAARGPFTNAFLGIIAVLRGRRGH